MPATLPAGTYTVDFWSRANLLRVAEGEQAWIYFKVFHCTAADPVGAQLLGFPATEVADGAAPAEYAALSPKEREQRRILMESKDLGGAGSREWLLGEIGRAHV